jgi:hypothetical protein
MDKVNSTLGMISTWLKHKDLQLAPQKTEAALLIGRKKVRKEVKFEIEGVEVVPKKNIKYLGVLIDRGLTFGDHIRHIADKVAKTTTALARLMPRVGGPSESKRRVLSSVANSIILYAAPVWSIGLVHQKYIKILESAQRKLAIRICRAYRTISFGDSVLLARLTPVKLLVDERIRKIGGQ